MKRAELPRVYVLTREQNSGLPSAVLRNRIEDMSNDQHSHSFRVDGILCNPKRTEETVVQQVSESIVADVPTFVLVLLSASR